MNQILITRKGSPSSPRILKPLLGMALTLDYHVVQVFRAMAFKPIPDKGFKLGLPLSLQVVQESESN
ncbi:hypothetical protein [Chamaesiphon sp. VAR_48_metabat_135_sub]|uniref:hypothetical protein n=1 Tax=Chamaesiphon sp. VAR_48_metabat_135_sub TaxID=2964699 RepID=UPI00286BA510|nr:hypothetical protein [Chamaesiphon sp. VAR_48_metabat_135_sub]